MKCKCGSDWTITRNGRCWRCNKTIGKKAARTREINKSNRETRAMAREGVEARLARAKADPRYRAWFSYAAPSPLDPTDGHMDPHVVTARICPRFLSEVEFVTPEEFRAAAGMKINLC